MVGFLLQQLRAWGTFGLFSFNTDSTAGSHDPHGPLPFRFSQGDDTSSTCLSVSLAPCTCSVLMTLVTQSRSPPFAGLCLVAPSCSELRWQMAFLSSWASGAPAQVLLPEMTHPACSQLIEDLSQHRPGTKEYLRRLGPCAHTSPTGALHPKAITVLGGTPTCQHDSELP